MFYRTSLQAVAALASISLLAGCGLFSDGDAEGEQKLSVGTMSEPTTLDPAAAWDGSWELFRNVYQTLLSFPTDSTTPQPDAAKSCRFTDTGNQTFQCELREGLEFSNGEKLDAAAVKHSIDRIKKIDVEGGPNGLLGSLAKVETTGDRIVTFRLNAADATFPFILATPAMAMVPPKLYPADKLREDGKLTGSGPYAMDSYKKGDRAVLSKNPKYQGFAKLKNDAVTIRYFSESEVMLDALKKKQIDAINRGLNAQEIVELQQGGKPELDHLQLVETVGADIRYLVFNPSDPMAGKLAVRRAVAQVVDRGALVATAYKGTAEPLYSMVPKGIFGHTTKFYDRFGEPDVAKAKDILEDAGITEPVPLTFWYTTDRYGSSTKDEFAELKRQLDGSGLFTITLQSKPWTEYQEGYKKGEYPVFGRGWFPDFPDPDNFIAPFVGEKNALNTPYKSPEIAQALQESRRESDRAAVAKQFDAAQEVLVDDVRLLPLWQGKVYIAASEEIGGGERAMDPQTIMQVWELYRKASW
ncbi:ABC transporter substrate-binding protein [Streptomyces sp. NPDC052236]|uniref:ABC transporter substrate-binding protein n=1 Tax=Streptomyces sp. NPDC052236 TaxID=3365686 RepID=UPI0037D8A222